MKTIIPLLPLIATTTSISNTLPPPMPASFPSVDQSLFITGPLLSDPLVTDALDFVNQVVDPKLLALKPSTYIQWSNVTYNDDAVGNCYWPKRLCTRDSDTVDFRADVIKCPKQNDWGIAYDDGPSVTGNGDDTPALRYALKSAGNIKATFFVIGANVQIFPDELRNLYNDGHQIASHTWTHHPLTTLTNAQIVAEFKYTEAMIYKSIGRIVKYYRPPYGDIDDRVRAIANALGYRTVMWTTSPFRDSGDSTGNTTKAESNLLLKTINDTWFEAQPGYISLEHNLDSFVTTLSIKVMEQIKQIGLDNIAVKPQPVATCIGDEEWYGVPTKGTNQTADNPTTNLKKGVDGAKPGSGSALNPAGVFFAGLFTFILVIAAGYLI